MAMTKKKAISELKRYVRELNTLLMDTTIFNEMTVDDRSIVDNGRVVLNELAKKMDGK